MYEHTIKLTGENSFAPGSPEYRICLHPNSEFAENYETGNPKMATIGSAVLVVVLTSLFFCLYDRLMRKQVNHQAALLQAKRQFMRFVSHEVRTPINSISMGMNLIQQEIAGALGYKSAEQLEEKLVHENPRTVKEENEAKSIAITGTQALEWFGLTRDILTNSEVATEVLSDFLDFDKIQSGSLQLEWTEVSIWDVLRRTCHEFKLPADAKGIKIIIVSNQQEKCSSNLEEGCCEGPREIQGRTVLGDPGRLTQVLRNLLSK
jgi:signal transduction histidine kinase